MARKKNLLQVRRTAPNEDLVVSNDNRSMRKGRRAAPRTEVCRPCLVWSEDSPDQKSQGVVLDLNPHGMRIRTLDPFAEGSHVLVQMMRDEEFTIPLSAPLTVRVMRGFEEDGFYDHGVKLVLKRIRHTGEVRLPRPPAVRAVRRLGTRMYTADYAIDEKTAGRSRR